MYGKTDSDMEDSRYFQGKAGWLVARRPDVREMLQGLWAELLPDGNRGSVKTRLGCVKSVTCLAATPVFILQDLKAVRGR